jgi:hypothetical protein
MEWRGLEGKGEASGRDRIGLERTGADRSGEVSGGDRMGLEWRGLERKGPERRNGLRPVAQGWRPGPDEQPTRKDETCTRKSMPSN